MREIRLKRIRKEYGYMVGTRISENQKVVDQAVIFNVIYLLVDDGKNYSIYQISDISNFNKLSDKKLRKLGTYLSNCNNWMYRSSVPITPNGELIQANIKGKYLRRTSFF